MSQSTQSTQPTLDRALRMRSVVLFGLAYMAPMIVLGTFGEIAEETKGAAASAYLLALVAMLFTAYSYGRMASTYPVAGSAYTYVRRTIDSRVGFLIGWATLLDYFFLPMVIWLLGATFLRQGFPGVPLWVWVIGFIVLTTVLNVVGIRVADKVNLLLMTFQLLVVAAFVVLSLRHLFGVGGAAAWFDAAPFDNPATTLAAIAGGAGIAAYSFLGFDAITTLTEETINPRRTMPRAILLVALLGGIIFTVVTYATQLVNAGMSLQALMAVLGHVTPEMTLRYATLASPTLRTAYDQAIGILICGVAGLIGLALDVGTAISMINFGAFLAFTAVNASVIALYYRRRSSERPLGALGYVALPLVGAVIDLYLLLHLQGLAKLLGVCWLALGLLYLVWLTSGFRRPPPQIDSLAAESEVEQPAPA